MGLSSSLRLNLRTDLSGEMHLYSDGFAQLLIAFDQSPEAI